VTNAIHQSMDGGNHQWRQVRWCRSHPGYPGEKIGESACGGGAPRGGVNATGSARGSFQVSETWKMGLGSGPMASPV
jgi:hypothetical protein